MASLSIDNLSSGYEKPLFHGLSFNINSPRILVVLGRNGSGKTTFLRSIAQQKSYTGNILLDGVDLKKIGIKERAANLAFQNQSTELSLNLKVKDLIVMGRFHKKGILDTYNEEDFTKAREYLKLFKIESFFEKEMSSLSGGERQMIWIIQTLIQETPLLLLDEPTTYLDLHNKKLFYDILQSHIQQDKILILVTHDLEYVKELDGVMINFSGDQKLREISPENIALEKSILEKY